MPGKIDPKGEGMGSITSLYDNEKTFTKNPENLRYYDAGDCIGCNYYFRLVNQ
ncbi:hypothetical protein KDW_50170 [Dictyobacter vulcani]|uniref:Uncharacterized protein n=1 Tax=Dictyobacter vulcani TaxID=2607529 RepID=A0A5J4KSI5_9CHLR|nr:hypothetical protein KDW_50170 [Dictyobacter vulcani]